MHTDPFAHQVAGSHYRGMGMQPIKFVMANGWDAGAFSVLKYISRHRSKKGVEDLRKARHFVDLRNALLEYALLPLDRIPMQDYVRANGIYELDHSALLHLEWWVQTGDDTQRQHLCECLDLLIAEYEEKDQPSLDL